MNTGAVANQIPNPLALLSKAMVVIFVSSLLLLFPPAPLLAKASSPTLSSSHQHHHRYPTPRAERGWISRRRIANTAVSTSLARARDDPLVIAVSRALSRRTKTNDPPKLQSSHPRQSVSSPSIPQRLVAGGISRGISQAVLYPIDALRTLAQTRDGRTLRDVGTKALLRGCFTTSSFGLFLGAIQFGIFGATRHICGPVLSSALGATGSCLLSVPQEVIKQRLVTGVYTSFRSACSTIYQTEGIRGFYSAWRPTMARNVPFVVICFTAMDALKDIRIQQKKRQGTNNNDIDNDNDNTTLTVLDNLAIGISSSLIAATLTNPADVVKTRMMTQAASTAVPYANTLDCIRTIWKNEGPLAFYAGFVQRTTYMGPLWATQFALNGKFLEAFGKQK